MKKMLTVFILLFTFCSNSFCQTTTEWATIEKGKFRAESTEYSTIFGVMNLSNEYVVFKKERVVGPGGWSYNVESFDNKLNSIGIVDISAQFEKDGYIFEHFFKVGEEYVLITSKRNRSEKNWSLYHQKYSRLKHGFEEPRLLFSQKCRKNKKIRSYFCVSPDHTSLLMMIWQPLTNKSLETPTFYVFDDNMELIWEKKYQTNVRDKSYAISKIFLGNNYQVYFLAGEYKMTEPPNRKYTISKYQVISLSSEAEHVQTISQKDFYWPGLSFMLPDNGNLFLAGYSTKEKGKIDGLYLCELDPDNLEIVYEEITPFTDQTLTSYPVIFKDVVKHDDGTYSMIMEEKWNDVKEGVYSGVGYYSVYGNLIVSRIGKNGVKHMCMKKEYADHGVFVCFNLDNDLAALYVCPHYYVVKNNPSIVETSGRDDFVLVLAILNKEGEVKNHVIMDYNDPKYQKYAPIFAAESAFLTEDEQGNLEIILESKLGKMKNGLLRIAID